MKPQTQSSNVSTVSLKSSNDTLTALLPPRTGNSEYTLVLDLDETLVHFEAKEKKFKLRPGCISFIKEMSGAASESGTPMFEIVIFTAAA